jgi:hypothetical protein
MADFIPQSIVKFNSWQSALISILQPNLSLWKINAEDSSDLLAEQLVWKSAYAKASNRKNRTSADVRDRLDSRKKYTTKLRKFIAEWLAHNSNVPNSERTRMGLTVKSGTHTPVAVPTTSPFGIVVFQQRMQHKLCFKDSETMHLKAKPAGVQGCEIWVKIDGSPPINESELTYLAIATRTPYIVDYNGSKIGKYAYYWLRWVNKRGKFGPWSRGISAMVAG